MATMPCDGCGRRVSVAGGIANLWSFEKDTTEGITLELADGTEHFLCFECVDDLPEDPSEADVAALPDRPPDEPIDANRADDDDDSELQWIGVGIALGAGVGLVLGSTFGALEYGLTTGAAVGLLLALLADRLSANPDA